MIEEELKQLEQITQALTSNGYLIDQTKEWRYAFDAVPDCVMVINPSFEVKFVNKELLERLDLSVHEILGKKCYKLLGFDEPIVKEEFKPHLVDEDLSSLCDKCHNKENCENKKGDVCDFGEAPIPVLGGIFSFTRSAIRSSAGKLLGFICVLREVTQERQLARTTEALLCFHRETHCLDKDGVIDFLLEKAVYITYSEVGYFHFVDESNLNEVNLSLFKWSEKVHDQCEIKQSHHYPLEDAGIWADSLRNRGPIIHNDYPSQASEAGLPEGHFPVQRHMSVPVFDGKKIVAICGVGNKDIDYTDSDAEVLSTALSTMWAVFKRKEAEAEAEEISSLTKTAIYEIDFIAGRFTFVNEGMCRHTGYTREELLKMGPKDILTEEGMQLWQNRFEDIKLGKSVPTTVEYRARLKDGSEVIVLCSVEHKIVSNQTIGARVVAIDITAQRELENKEREKSLENRVVALTSKLQDTENECRMLTDYLTVRK